MAIITKSIGTSSRDYSTLQAWEDSIPASMGSDSYVGECYNDSEFTGKLTFSGSSTGASNTITLKCATGQSFRDNASIQTNALRYNQSNGVGISNASYATNIISVSEDYVTIDGLQVKKITYGNRCFYSNLTTLTHNTYKNCILELGTSNGSDVAQTRSETWINCLFIGYGGTGSPAILLPYSSPKFINCTVVRPSDYTSSTAAAFKTNTTPGGMTVKNCAVFGYNSVTDADGSFSGSNNCSDKTIGFGTSNQASKTYANQFVNTTAASGDFKIKTGSDCIDTGVTDTAASPDIAGTTRPQGSAYDIGCWELVSAVSTPKSIESDLIIYN